MDGFGSSEGCMGIGEVCSILCICCLHRAIEFRVHRHLQDVRKQTWGSNEKNRKKSCLQKCNVFFFAIHEHKRGQSTEMLWQHILHFGLVSCLKLTAFTLHKADNQRRPQFSSISASNDHSIIYLLQNIDGLCGQYTTTFENLCDILSPDGRNGAREFTRITTRWKHLLSLVARSLHNCDKNIRRDLVCR